METRRHWFSIVKHGGLLLVLAVLVLLLALGSLFFPIPIALKWGGGLLIFLALLLVGWFIFDWTNDYFILTNQRVIFVDKTAGIQERRSEAPMNKVHNVRIEITGRFAQILNYGNLALDTAGLGVLSFDTLPNPRYLREKILEVRRQINQEALPVREERRRAVLRDRLGGLNDPNDKPMEAPYTTPQESGMDQFNILFPHRSQRQGETVVWHRHWLFLLRDELKPIGLLLFVIALWILTGIISNNMATPSDPYALPDAAPQSNGLLDTLNRVITIAVIIAFVIIIPWMWYIYEDWRNDKYSLTHDRVLTVYKKPLGGREVVTETMFGRITDVSYTIRSPIAMMFNYGTVTIKTPGEATAFLFESVPDPRAVQQEITTRLESHRAREAAQWDNDIVDWLAVFGKYFAPYSPAQQATRQMNLDNPRPVTRPEGDNFFNI